MNIRYYQEEAIWAIYNYFAASQGHPIVAMPTASGKSVVIAKFCQSVLFYWPGQRILCLTHVKELIRQNYNKLIQVWPMAPAGIYSAGLKQRDVRPITFAGIQSCHSKAELFGHFDIIFIDECHLLSPNQATTYRKFLDAMMKINPKLKVIGLSATPYRMGQGLLTHDVAGKNGKIMKALFTDVCYDITKFEDFNRLIAEGFLSPLVTKKPIKEIDLTGVAIVAGEYNQHDLQAAADRDEITRSAITEIEQQAAKSAAEGIARTRWLVFSTGVEHAKHIAEEFATRGYDVRCVTDDTNDEDRDAAVEWYKAKGDGRVRVLVNNRIFTTGFDVPEVDLIGVLLATNSTSLWVQLLGRGMRVAPWANKVNCLVLDFGGNIRRLGPVNDPILPRKKGSKTGQGAPVRCCEACGTYNHASARFCVSCQAEFPVAVKFGETASDAEVMSTGSTEPIIEVHEVTQVTYSRHNSKREGVPDSLRVTYNSNHRAWSKFVCLEHEGHAGHLARKWWRERCRYEPPTDIGTALQMQGELTPPTHIRVWENRKPYPQIMAEDFTGTGFGGQPAKEVQEEIPF